MKDFINVKTATSVALVNVNRISLLYEVNGAVKISMDNGFEINTKETLEFLADKIRAAQEAK